MPLNIDWQQILLHLLNFVILFAGLWLLLYKPVRKFMQKRREEYENKDAETERKKSEAEQLRAQYEQKLADADAEIEAKRLDAKKEMDAYAALRKNAAQEEADAIVKEAHRQQAEPSVCVITWPSNRDRLPMVKGLPFFTQVSLTNNFVA